MRAFGLRIVRRSLATAAAALSLTACASQTTTVAVVPPLSPVPIYCYATLAQTDCYAELQDRGTGRLVGAYVIERR